MVSEPSSTIVRALCEEVPADERFEELRRHRRVAQIL